MSANDDSASRTSNPSSVQKSSGEKATSEQQYTGQGAQEAPDVAGGVGNPDIDFPGPQVALIHRATEKKSSRKLYLGVRRVRLPSKWRVAPV